MNETEKDLLDRLLRWREFMTVMCLLQVTACAVVLQTKTLLPVIAWVVSTALMYLGVYQCRVLIKKLRRPPSSE